MIAALPSRLHAWHAEIGHGHRCLGGFKNSLAFHRACPERKDFSLLQPQTRGCSVATQAKRSLLRKRKGDGSPVFENFFEMPPLGPNQPPLRITYTNDGLVVSRWMQSHINNCTSVLGFDTETVPSVRSSRSKFKGPSTLQIATAGGACLVVHLAHVSKRGCYVDPASGIVRDVQNSPSLCRLRGLDDLATLLQDSRVLKAGVGIDLDAIDLWREHRLQVGGRFDLGGVGNRNLAQTQSLLTLTQTVLPGFKLPKSKKLSMSDWSVLPLTSQQLEYAAADAFASAAVVSALMSTPQDQSFNLSTEQLLPCLADIDRLRSSIAERERPIEKLEQRATRRRAAKQQIAACEEILKLAQDAENTTSPAEIQPALRKLWKEFCKEPRAFHANLKEARIVFRDMRPDPVLFSDDFAALGLTAVSQRT